MEHWLNKSVMRALVKKGWLVVLEASPTAQPPVPAPPVSKKVLEPVVQAEKPVVVVDKHGPVNLDSLAEDESPPKPEIIPEETEEEPVEVPQEISEEVPHQPPAEVPEKTLEEAPQEAIKKTEREPEAIFPTRGELEQMAFAQLRELGKTYGISARAKADLVDRIEKAQVDGKQISEE
jgi:hypothetical protein